MCALIHRKDINTISFTLIRIYVWLWSCMKIYFNKVWTMRRNWVANEKTRHFTTEPNFKSMREKNVKKMKMFVEKHIEWIYQKLTMVPCASQSWRNIYTHFSYTKNHWDSFINSLIWEWMRDSTCVHTTIFNGVEHRHSIRFQRNILHNHFPSFW